MILALMFNLTPYYFIHYADPQIGRNPSAFPNCTLAVHQIAVLNPAPSFIIIAGDMGESQNDTVVLKTQWHLCDSLFNLIPASGYFTPGNHDIGYASDAFWTPQRLSLYRSFWGADYFSFDYDSCHFVVLNSTLLDTYSGHSCYPYSLEQDSFLRADLSNLVPETYHHIFLLFHFPLYVSSPAEANSLNNVDRPRRDTILANLVKYNVTAVFTGHLHYNLQNFYGPSILIGGLTTSETNINACGYRVVKVFDRGIETYTIWLNAPQTSVPLVQAVAPGVSPETVQVGQTVLFNCIVDSIQFPEWQGLTYRWQFGDGQSSVMPNTNHAYADTGHFNVVFAAYKNPNLSAHYHFQIVVLSGQKVGEGTINYRDVSRFRIIPSVTKDCISFEMDADADIRIDVYQIDGRILLSNDYHRLSKGVHKFELKKSLNPGIYFLRWTAKGRTGIEKFVLIY